MDSGSHGSVGRAWLVPALEIAGANQEDCWCILGIAFASQSLLVQLRACCCSSIPAGAGRDCWCVPGIAGASQSLLVQLNTCWCREGLLVRPRDHGLGDPNEAAHLQVQVSTPASGDVGLPTQAVG